MQTLNFVLLLTMAIAVAGCSDKSRAVPPLPLEVYMVNPEELSSGLLPTPERIRELGLEPDMVISRLVQVSKGAGHVLIRMTKADANQFEALTERAIGKTLLLMIGEEPLAAPAVTAPIPMPTQTLAIVLGETLNADAIEAQLRTLVR